MVKRIRQIGNILLIATLCSYLIACSGQPLTTEMQACPKSPNCVSSREQGEAYIKAFSLRVPARQAWPEIIKAIEAMPRTKLVEESPGYIHATATSLVFRFVDDLELELLSDGKTVDIRSASRRGYSDMGVNRSRVESLRKALQAQKIIE